MRQAGAQSGGLPFTVTEPWGSMAPGLAAPTVNSYHFCFYISVFGKENSQVLSLGTSKSAKYLGSCFLAFFLLRALRKKRKGTYLPAPFQEEPDSEQENSVLEHAVTPLGPASCLPWGAVRASL